MSGLKSERLMLIIEDDGTTRRALGSIFARRGWRVCLATDVAEGLTLLEHGLEPDCLILDLMLPDGGGEVVLERVKELDLKTHVAVCTGVHDEARLRRVRSMKPHALLTKPINLDNLTALCDSSC